LVITQFDLLHVITCSNMALLGWCMASLMFRDVLPFQSSSFKKNAWEAYSCSEMWIQLMFDGSVNELLGGKEESLN
jgi:hypothetical protein